MEQIKNDFINLYLTDKGQTIDLEPTLTEKPRSLKVQHFKKFVSNILIKNQKLNNSKTISLTENFMDKRNYMNNNEKSLKQKLFQSSTEHIFKDPRNINYKLLKYNPIKSHYKLNFNCSHEKSNITNKINNNNNTSENDKERTIKDSKSITFYNMKFNKFKEKKNFDNEDNNIKSNNINVHNIYHSQEYNYIIDKIKEFNCLDKSKKKKIKKYYQNNIREGLFGKKDPFGIPYFYDTSTIFKNEYSTKSEKNRHELLAKELNKLKSYLIRHPDKKLYLLKDFLGKFYIDEIEKYSEEQLLNLCDFIINVDANTISNSLKPYLNIKDMIYDILNNSIELNNSYLEENNIKENERYNNYNEKDNNKNKDKDKFFNCKISKSVNKKTESPRRNILYKDKFYLSPLINNDNYKYFITLDKEKKTPCNKSEIFTSDTRAYSNFDDNQNNNNNMSNIKPKKFDFDIFSTNSKLKYIEYQTKTFFPKKNYSNRNIIVKEIGKEIKEIENDFNEKLKNLELLKNNNKKKIINFLNKPRSFKIGKMDKLYINIKNRNNSRLKIFAPIHYNLTKNFQGEMKELDDAISNKNILLNSENDFYRERLLTMDNCCLNSTERKSKNNIEGNKNMNNTCRSGSLDKIKKSKKSNVEIIKRLYYIPTRKKFGLQEIKSRLKLTEYFALTHAKKSIYNQEVKKIVDMQK